MTCSLAVGDRGAATAPPRAAMRAPTRMPTTKAAAVARCTISPQWREEGETNRENPRSFSSVNSPARCWLLLAKRRADRMQRKDSFGRRNHSRLHLNKKRLRYVFTVQDVHLSCGSAVLMPASATSQPSVTLTWKSGKKLALGGVGRHLPEGADGSGERGARWETPVRRLSRSASPFHTPRGRLQP